MLDHDGQRRHRFPRLDRDAQAEREMLDQRHLAVRQVEVHLAVDDVDMPGLGVRGGASLAPFAQLGADDPGLDQPYLGSRPEGQGAEQECGDQPMAHAFTSSSICSTYFSKFRANMSTSLAACAS